MSCKSLSCNNLKLQPGGDLPYKTAANLPLCSMDKAANGGKLIVVERKKYPQGSLINLIM